LRSGFALARTEGQCITRPRVTNECARRLAPERHQRPRAAHPESAEFRALRDEPADLVHDAGDLVTQRDRRRDVGIFSEVSVHQLHVAAAHFARPDVDEDLIGLNIRNRHVLEDESLAIFVHACRFHSPSSFSCVGA
jgi:hypothetical protein